MSNFSIDDEIDKAVDKLADQLKTRLKKLVIRSEKMVLKQYIASQKETTRTAKPAGRRANKNTDSGHKAATKASAKNIPKREDDYGLSSESDFSDSDRD